MNARNRKRLDKGSRWLASGLDDTILVCCPLARLKPHYQLQSLNAAETGYTWQATGEDPQFVLTRGLPLPGWQMLEVAMEHDQPSAAVKLYLDTGKGLNEELCVYLPLKSGRVTKRLFYVPRRLKALRFDPLECEGRFTITHLRIAWLSPGFAHDRLAHRLANMHHEFRGVTKAEVLPLLKRQAREAGRHWREFALEQYEATFERRTARYSYRKWLEGRRELTTERARRVIDQLPHTPLISVLVPVFNPRLEWLRECLDSVLAQSYPHWQLCIADDASTDPEVGEVLAEYAERDSRLQVVYRQRNGHICAASNSALQLVRGDFVACWITMTVWLPMRSSMSPRHCTVIRMPGCCTATRTSSTRPASASTRTSSPNGTRTCCSPRTISATLPCSAPLWCARWAVSARASKAARIMIWCCASVSAWQPSRSCIFPMCSITGGPARAPRRCTAMRRTTPPGQEWRRCASMCRRRCLAPRWWKGIIPIPIGCAGRCRSGCRWSAC